MRGLSGLSGLSALIPASYLFDDEFTTAFLAGNVNGTAAEPGPGGVRNVTDTENKLSISGGAAVYAAGKSVASNTDPICRYAQTVARSVGLGLVGAVSATTYGALRAGFGGASGSLSPAFEFPARAFSGGAAQPNFMSLVNGTTYRFAVVCRASGEWYFVKGGIYSNWTLVWISVADTTTPLYIGHSVNNGSNVNFDYLRIFSGFAPTPLANDGFGGAFGITDGQFGEITGLGSGGAGLTWTQQLGTWANGSGKTAASALSGGVAQATVATSTADVLAEIKVTRAAGVGGLTLRWIDANNHIRAYHDGTNAKLDQVVAGVVTNKITGVATYSAGAVLRVDLSGTNGRLYYGNTFIGTTGTLNAGLTGTPHGLYTTDTSNGFDDFLAMAKGTSGEYSALDNV